MSVIAAPFVVWIYPHLAPDERRNPNLSGMRFDPDGVLNLVEYGVGSDPRDGRSGALPAVEILTLANGPGDPCTPATYLAIRFKRRLSDPQLAVVVEVATDVANWSSGAGVTVEVSTTPIDADFEDVTVRSAVSLEQQKRQQLRVRFELAGAGQD